MTESQISARAAPLFQNIKTLISPLLKRPQGCQGCQNDREDPRINPMVRFCASFQPKMNEIRKITKKQYFFHDFCRFLSFFVIYSDLAEN